MAPPDGPSAHDGLVRRQQAMIRYYQRLFGVSPIDQSALDRSGADDGWLWRPNPSFNDLIPPACTPEDCWGPC